MVRLSLALLLLAGCTSASPIVGQHERVTVILAGQEDVTRACAPGARGCVFQFRRPVVIICPFNDAVCLAHEIAHLLGWDHP